MQRLIVSATASLLMLALGSIRPAGAAADDVNLGTDSDGFTAGATAHHSADGPSTGVDALPAGHWAVTSSCDLGGLATCTAGLTCPDGKPMQRATYFTASGLPYRSYTYCPGTNTTGPTTADIQTAFARLPMSAAPLHVQPPGGETLVNFDTIYFSEPTVIDKRISLLGASVDFHITVAAYVWHYGDGQTQTTSDPGAAYPRQTIVHRYPRKGTVKPSLDTTYQADYRIDGGSWQHLAQTVTIAGAPQALTIRTATPHLVDSDG